jgi:hypothetical protein
MFTSPALARQAKCPRILEHHRISISRAIQGYFEQVSLTIAQICDRQVTALGGMFYPCCALFISSFASSFIPCAMAFHCCTSLVRGSWTDLDNGHLISSLQLMV